MLPGALVEKNPSLHPHGHFLAKYSFIYCTSIYVASALCLPFSQTPEIYPGTKQKIQTQLHFRKVKKKQTFFRPRGAPVWGSWGQGKPAASGRGKAGYCLVESSLPCHGRWRDMRAERWINERETAWGLLLHVAVDGQWKVRTLWLRAWLLAFCGPDLIFIDLFTNSVSWIKLLNFFQSPQIINSCAK